MQMQDNRFFLQVQELTLVPKAIELLREDSSLRAIGLVVTDVLGQGGSAVVYRARDARHGRDVAVKVLRSASPLDKATLRFAQEVLVAGRLRHAHMLPLFDSGRLQDGRLFSVMPVAEGRPLSSLISEGPLGVADAVRIARETAEALGYLHRSGFVHRDVKPENILVESGHAVLTDFGIAIAHGSSTAGEPEPPDADGNDVVPVGGRRFTQTGRIVGTLSYMSPESMMADASVDYHRDIYALGVVLYEMLAGKLPFKSNSPVSLMANRLRAGIPRIRSVRPDVPEEIETIIVRCTSADSTKTFRTADEVATALAATQVGQSALHARPRWMAPAAVVLVAAIIGATVFGLNRGSSQSQPLDPNRVVVADLANDTGDPALSTIGKLAGDIIVSRLTQQTKLTVVNASIALPSRLQRHLPPADSTLARMTRSLVTSTRAGLVVTGAYFRVGGGLEVVAQFTNTESGRVLGTVGPVDAPMARPDSALRVLGDGIVAILNRSPP